MSERMDQFEAMAVIVGLPPNERDAALRWMADRIDADRVAENRAELRRAVRRMRDRARRLARV